MAGTHLVYKKDITFLYRKNQYKLSYVYSAVSVAEVLKKYGIKNQKHVSLTGPVAGPFYQIYKMTDSFLDYYNNLRENNTLGKFTVEGFLTPLDI